MNAPADAAPLPNPLIRRYLDQLQAALAQAPLPLAEQAAILADIESHIAEALSSGERLPDVLERLGNAADLARAYGVEAFLHPRSGGGPPRLAAWSLETLRTVTVVAAALLVGLLTAAGISLLLAGALGALAGLIAPALPLDPNLRAGMPQVVVVALSLLLAGLGAGLLRLVHWNLGLLRRPRIAKEPRR